MLTETIFTEFAEGYQHQVTHSLESGHSLVDISLLGDIPAGHFPRPDNFPPFYIV